MLADPSTTTATDDGPVEMRNIYACIYIYVYIYGELLFVDVFFLF